MGAIVASIEDNDSQEGQFDAVHRNAKIRCHYFPQLMKSNPWSKPFWGRSECFCLRFKSTFFFFFLILEYIKQENSKFTQGFPPRSRENNCSRGWRISFINISPVYFPVLFTDLPNRFSPVFLFFNSKTPSCTTCCDNFSFLLAHFHWVGFLTWSGSSSALYLIRYLRNNTDPQTELIYCEVLPSLLLEKMPQKNKLPKSKSMGDQVHMMERVLPSHLVPFQSHECLEHLHQPGLRHQTSVSCTWSCLRTTVCQIFLFSLRIGKINSLITVHSEISVPINLNLLGNTFLYLEEF